MNFARHGQIDMVSVSHYIGNRHFRQGHTINFILIFFIFVVFIMMITKIHII